MACAALIVRPGPSLPMRAAACRCRASGAPDRRRRGRASSSRRADRRGRDGPRARGPAPGRAMAPAPSRSAAQDGRRRERPRGSLVAAIAASVSRRGALLSSISQTLSTRSFSRAERSRAAGAAATDAARSARRRRRRRRRRRSHWPRSESGATALAPRGRRAAARPAPAAAARSARCSWCARRAGRTKYAKYEATTGAAQTSSTSDHRQPPARGPVRRRTASVVDGSEWTLKLTSSAESGLGGADESMPDIEEGDAGREGEPLEGVAVVLLHVDGRRRPVARRGRRPARPERPAARPRAAAASSPVSRANEAMSRFCRIGPLAAPANSNSRDGAGATMPSTATMPCGRGRAPAARCAIGEVARRPAALDEHAPEPASSASGVTTKKPTLPSIWRLSRKTVRSASQRPRRPTRRWCCASAAAGDRASDAASSAGSRARASRLACSAIFWCRAIELPEAEPRREGDAGERREQRSRRRRAPALRRRARERADVHEEPAAVTRRRRP